MNVRLSNDAEKRLGGGRPTNSQMRGLLTASKQRPEPTSGSGGGIGITEVRSRRSSCAENSRQRRRTVGEGADPGKEPTGILEIIQLRGGASWALGRRQWKGNLAVAMMTGVTAAEAGEQIAAGGTGLGA